MMMTLLKKSFVILLLIILGAVVWGYASRSSTHHIRQDATLCVDISTAQDDGDANSYAVVVSDGRAIGGQVKDDADRLQADLDTGTPTATAHDLATLASDANCP